MGVKQGDSSICSLCLLFLNDISSKINSNTSTNVPAECSNMRALGTKAKALMLRKAKLKEIGLKLIKSNRYVKYEY